MTNAAANSPNIHALILNRDVHLARIGPATTAMPSDVLALYRHAAAAHREIVPDDDARMGLLRQVKNPVAGFLVIAWHDGAPVGIVTGRRYDKDARRWGPPIEKARDLLLPDLVVHPDHRGRGIGRMLLNDALQRAKKWNCRSLSVNIGVSNDTVGGTWLRRHGFRLEREPNAGFPNILLGRDTAFFLHAPHIPPA